MAMPDRAIIGQYWPEDSLVHAMDPRVKFILSFVLMAAVFCAATPLSLAVAALFIVGFYAASRIPLLQAIRAIGPLLVLVVLTADHGFANVPEFLDQQFPTWMKNL